MAKKIIHWITGVVTTSGVATDNVLTLDFAQPLEWPNRVAQDNCVATCEVFVSARNVVGTVGAGGSFGYYATVRRVSGTVTIVSSAPNSMGLMPQAGIVGASIAMDVSGTTLRVRGTGIVSQDIEWFGSMRVYLN